MDTGGRRPRAQRSGDKHRFYAGGHLGQGFLHGRNEIGTLDMEITIRALEYHAW